MFAIPIIVCTPPHEGHCVVKCSIQQTQVAIESDGNSRGDKATAQLFFDFGNPTNAVDMLRPWTRCFEDPVCAATLIRLKLHTVKV